MQDYIESREAAFINMDDMRGDQNSPFFRGGGGGPHGWSMSSSMRFLSLVTD
jgi:hypothetical protein